MCEPTTMAAIGTWMGASAGTATAVGTATTLAAASAAAAAYSANQQAKGQKAMANYQAQVANNNAIVSEYQAQDLRKRGEENAAAARRMGEKIKGQQRVGLAASGLDISSGTAQELQNETDFFSLTDQNTARDNAAKDAWAKRNQVDNYRSDSQMSRAVAGSISPGGNTAVSLLSSAGQVSSRWYQG